MSAAKAMQKRNPIILHIPPFVFIITYNKKAVNVARFSELKTKPPQASVKDLQGMGIQPDIIVCRSEHPLDQSTGGCGISFDPGILYITAARSGRHKQRVSSPASSLQ